MYAIRSYYEKLFGLVSADAHYSMDKAANILGIGTDQLLKAPLDENASRVVAELTRILRKTP